MAGLGGYHNLHKLNASVGTTDPATTANLVAADDQHWGYLTLTVDANSISGNLTTVANTNDSGNAQADTFSYPAAAQYLAAGLTISL